MISFISVISPSPESRVPSPETPRTTPVRTRLPNGTRTREPITGVGTRSRRLYVRAPIAGTGTATWTRRMRALLGIRRGGFGGAARRHPTHLGERSLQIFPRVLLLVRAA